MYQHVYFLSSILSLLYDSNDTAANIYLLVAVNVSENWEVLFLNNQNVTKS